MDARERGKVYDRTQGHCAFCGRKIPFAGNWEAEPGFIWLHQPSDCHEMPSCKDCHDAISDYDGDMDSVRRALKEKHIYPIDEHISDMSVVLRPVFKHRPFDNTDELSRCLMELSKAIDDAQFVFYYEKQDRKAEDEEG